MCAATSTSRTSLHTLPDQEFSPFHLADTLEDFCDAHPNTSQWCWHCHFKKKKMPRVSEKQLWSDAKHWNIPFLFNSHVLVCIGETQRPVRAYKYNLHLKNQADEH